MRFCPFCREPFEDVTHCPTHDLALVDINQLPRDHYAEEPPAELFGAPIPPASPLYGRGPLFFGALGYGLSFFFAFARVGNGTQERTYSTFEAAVSRAPNLWSIPFAGIVLVGLLWRKRTLSELASVRFASFCVALVPPLAAAYSFLRIRAASEHIHWSASPALGLWIVGCGAALALFGAFRLGRVTRMNHHE